MDEGSRLLFGSGIDGSQVNDNRPFDSSAVTEGVVEHLDLRKVRMEVNYCLYEDTLRSLIKGRGTCDLIELERGNEMADLVSGLVESGVENEERDIERVEQDRTRSGVMVVVSFEEVIRAGSEVVIVEEKVKFLKYTRFHSQRRHGRRVIGVNKEQAISSEVRLLDSH